jgi:hypothetical protein
MKERKDKHFSNTVNLQDQEKLVELFKRLAWGRSGRNFNAAYEVKSVSGTNAFGGHSQLCQQLGSCEN